MRFHLSIEGDQIHIMARATGEGIIGDLDVYLGPGEAWDGVAYEDLLTLGKGAHSLEDLLTLTFERLKGSKDGL
jgi:hypothetical protein